MVSSRVLLTPLIGCSLLFAAAYAGSLRRMTYKTQHNSTYIGVQSNCKFGQNCQESYPNTDCNGLSNGNGFGSLCPSYFGFKTNNPCNGANFAPNTPCYAVQPNYGQAIYCPSGWAATQMCSSGSGKNCPNPTMNRGGGSNRAVVAWLYCSFFIGVNNQHAVQNYGARGALPNPEENSIGKEGGRMTSGTFNGGKVSAVQTAEWPPNGANYCPENSVVTGMCTSGSGANCYGNQYGVTQCSYLTSGTLGQSVNGVKKQNTPCSSVTYGSGKNTFISPECPYGSVMTAAASSGGDANQKCPVGATSNYIMAYSRISCQPYTPAITPPPAGKVLPFKDVSVSWYSNGKVGETYSTSFTLTTEDSSTSTHTSETEWGATVQQSVRVHFSVNGGSDVGPESFHAGFSETTTLGSSWGDDITNTLQSYKSQTSSTTTTATLTCDEGAVWQVQYKGAHQGSKTFSTLSATSLCIDHTCPNFAPCCLPAASCADDCCRTCKGNVEFAFTVESTKEQKYAKCGGKNPGT